MGWLQLDLPCQQICFKLGLQCSLVRLGHRRCVKYLCYSAYRTFLGDLHIHSLICIWESWKKGFHHHYILTVKPVAWACIFLRGGGGQMGCNCCLLFAMGRDLRGVHVYWETLFGALVQKMVLWFHLHLCSTKHKYCQCVQLLCMCDIKMWWNGVGRGDTYAPHHSP